MMPRVAQVGCGYWGKNLARALNKVGALAATVDESEQLAHSVAAEHGVQAASFREVLGDPSIHAVSIATPAATHHQVALQCLRAGKDLFVEKPMALEPRDAEEMIEVAATEGRVLMVGHLLNYHPSFERLNEIVRDGRLGRLRYLYSNRLNFGKIRREEDILWSFAPHDISMILRLAGETPSEVRSTGTFALHPSIADVTTTHMKFPSGIDAHIFVSWLHPYKEQRLVVVGDEGMAVFDDRADWPEKLTVYRGRVDWTDGVPTASPMPPEHVEVEASEPLLLEMEHFLECVSSRQQPTTDGHEGLRVLEVLHRATRDLLDVGEDDSDQRSAIDGIHDSAFVDEDVHVGSGTLVWHFSHLLPHTTIGRDCSLGQNVVVGPNVTIGDGCKIQNNVSVYEGVTLEDGVFCGPSMVFTNVTNPRAEVGRRNEFKPTLVKTGASIGANATVVCGTTIGRYSMIGAGAVVTRNVPDHALVAGVPARRVGWVSFAGEILDEALVCPRTGEQYSLVNGQLELAEEQS